MDSYTTFYIVRHGETEFNVKGIAQGHLDSPLTEKGVEEAARLAFKFKDINFDAVFSSDLFRTKRTADIIKLERKLAVETTTLLRERSYGKLEGKPYSAIRAYRNFLKELSDQDPGLGDLIQFESDESVTLRLITFLRETAITNIGKVILVVTHGGVMRMFLKHLGYIDMPSGSVDNLGYMKIETDGVDFFIKETEGIRLKNE